MKGGFTGHISRRSCHFAHLRGVALPLVLLISSMMLTTSAIWFETSLVAARNTTNIYDYLQAFHAADSALTLCGQTLTTSITPVAPAVGGEPVAWKRQATFEANAFTPVAQWSGSSRPPQCLVEPWQLGSRPEAQAFLLTARGFGATPDTQVWLQLEIAIDGERTERRWRRVAARPY
ncbi:Tfp pilus assembly protein PilX [Paraburkholderia sp. GAS448]|uniref:pilus assembly PilX family protein n=1 Tax=Paraburkholderia sp. GAS448 TaxID=3035136 RepID=UPI003D1A1FC8